MPPSSGGAARFEQRAARAEALAKESEAAREPLRFAAGLYRAQARSSAALEAEARRTPFSGSLERDLARAGPLLKPVLLECAERGPALLAEEARALDDEIFGPQILAYWRGENDAWLARAILRPYVEVLAAVGVRPDRPGVASGCPFCGCPPWVAERRSTADADAGARFLHCGLCAAEWPIPRIRCPACGESNPDKLPVFAVDEHREARLETCDSCRQYVKSIDRTTDARRIPEVDDLLSISMDLWAEENGYARIEPGLAGI